VGHRRPLDLTGDDEVGGEERSSDDDNSLEDDEEYNRVEDAPVAMQWCMQKWPGNLTRAKEAKYQLSGYCRGRTQLYHALLHYKLRLLLKVRDKLNRVGGNVNELISDRAFCATEADRYQSLLDMATKGFGGAGMEDTAVKQVTGVWDDGVGNDDPVETVEQRVRHKAEGQRSARNMLSWLGKGRGRASSAAEDDENDFE
jgi:hypothetical protein